MISLSRPIVEQQVVEISEKQCGCRRVGVKCSLPPLDRWHGGEGKEDQSPRAHSKDWFMRGPWFNMHVYQKNEEMISFCCCCKQWREEWDRPELRVALVTYIQCRRHARSVVIHFWKGVWASSCPSKGWGPSESIISHVLYVRMK